MRSIVQAPYYWWRGELSDSLCDAIIEEAGHFELKEAGIGGKNEKDLSYRQGLVSWIPEDHWIEQIVRNYVIKANSYAKWNFIINDKEQVQFGMYGAGAYYKWHRDCNIHDIKYRKLSVTVQLSDPKDYEGGEFQIKDFWNHHILPAEEGWNERGTVVVFPSILMHQVTEVTKGTRYSLVQWYDGPDWV